jgi:hypothetical protein
MLALCLTEIDSWLTGKRAVGLPFSDECPILGLKDISEFQSILEQTLGTGRERGWKTIEIRGAPAGFKGNRSEAFFTHELKLSGGIGEAYAGFEGSVKRAIRKGEREGIQAEVRHDAEAVEDYFTLHCLTRRKHCLPPQPVEFFRNIFRHVIMRGMGFTVLARLNGQVLAGAVFLRFRDRGLYKFGASNPALDYLRPNNVVMWRGIQEFCRQGVRDLSFGRTSFHQEGLRRYKLGWGSREREVSYVRLNVVSGSYAAERGSAQGNWLFGKMPIPLLRRAGELLYPHIG